MAARAGLSRPAASFGSTERKSTRSPPSPKTTATAASGGSRTALRTLQDEVAGNDDVAALLGSGWVPGRWRQELWTWSPRSQPNKRPGAVTYGPLGDTPESVDPDVVLIRVNGRQMMVLSDAMPGLRIEGKPQCHIVALAAEHDQPAASVGCALSAEARIGHGPRRDDLRDPGRST